MRLDLNIRILAVIIAFFSPLAPAQICPLTPSEAQSVASISLLQALPIWRDFPTRYVFAVREFEAPTRGFYVVTPDERAQLLRKNLVSACAENTHLVQAAEPLTRLHGRFYPHCSANVPEACMEIPHLSSVFRELGKPVGTIGIERAHLKQIDEIVGNLGYSFSQISMYHAIHEMFHEYQT